MLYGHTFDHYDHTVPIHDMQRPMESPHPSSGKYTVHLLLLLLLHCILYITYNICNAATLLGDTLVCFDNPFAEHFVSVLYFDYTATG